ncbi:carotenoid 1,2-hydratase [Burkholderia alba]|uniref:carotenoid 1,2-hydratase n=1 Tax=Burkholderia alba TaxID=2683677 RepID=UPI002B05D5CC|nr:carotenoid 1,2-hydratase [Burkholderia alba]
MNISAKIVASRVLQQFRLFVRWSIGICLFFAATFASAVTPQIFIPQDQSPHNSSTKEWWYYTGHLSGTDPQGKVHNYGYELTFFKTGALPPPLANGYVANFAVTDLTKNTYQSDERIIVQPNVLPKGGGFDIQMLDWSMSGLNNNNTMRAAFSNQSYSLTLNLTSSTQAVLHGDGGVIPYGPFDTSKYYSYTNLQTTGTIIDHGVPITVTGTSWHDHQWFNADGQVGGWDWFSVQLDNGTQYMVYLIRDITGAIVQKVGTQVNKDGSYAALDSRLLGDTALGTWTSPVTLQTYSSGWLLMVPNGQLTIQPQKVNQEVLSLPPEPRYWEGASTVSGVIDGIPVKGVGYTEITPPQVFP